MNQIEEFDKYYYLAQINETENPPYDEEPKNEEIYEENVKNLIVKEEDIKDLKILKQNMSTSKRLSSLPKRYQTYTLEYKRQIIEQVNKFIN